MSILKPNNIHDVNIMLPLIKQVRKVGELHTQYLVADLGYLDAEDQKKAFHDHDMAVVTGFKSNTVLPEPCDTSGRPECEQGQRLVWYGFDKETATSWFRGDESCYWLDRFYPEFTEVFKDWEGKAVLVCLRQFPCPADIQEKTTSESVRAWRDGGISRGVGMSKANLMKEKTEQSIGLTEGLKMGHQELGILLRQYDLYQEQLALLMSEIEQLASQIPGTQEMISIPGVGLVTVAGFLAEVGDLSAYDNPRQIQKLAGSTSKKTVRGSTRGRQRSADGDARSCGHFCSVPIYSA